MAKASFDFDFAQEIFLYEVLDGNGREDLEQLDAKFAEQLQFQEAIFSSVNEMLSPTSKSMIIQEKEKLNGKKHYSARKSGEFSLCYCEICFERKERHQMFEICRVCSHSFCSDCISKYVKTTLEQNVTIITCPRENCGLLLELEACRLQLPKEVIDLWEDLLCEELLCATGGRLYCPFKDCSALLLNDDGDQEDQVITETECPVCHRLFCVQCNVSWHPGITCEEYQKLNEDERERDDIFVKNLAEENKWRRCPSCHIIVERTEGCLHMTCRCKFEFCYACGAEWSHDHGCCQGN